MKSWNSNTCNVEQVPCLRTPFSIHLNLSVCETFLPQLSLSLPRPDCNWERQVNVSIIKKAWLAPELCEDFWKEKGGQNYGLNSKTTEEIHSYLTLGVDWPPEAPFGSIQASFLTLLNTCFSSRGSRLRRSVLCAHLVDLSPCFAAELWWEDLGYAVWKGQYRHWGGSG